MKRLLVFVCAILSLVAAIQAQSLSKIEGELVSHLNKLEAASNYTGSRDQDVQTKENLALRRALLKYGKRSDVLRYTFPKLGKLLFIRTSNDGKLRTYSWDTESGGTMHDYWTVYQFLGKTGRTYSWASPYYEDVGDRGIGAFVHDIFQTNTNNGTIYLEVSTFIGSTSLAGQSITAIKINGNKLGDPKVIKTGSGFTNTVRFEYDFFSVVDRPERPIKLFSFNEKEKSFRFPVVIQDEKTPQGRVTDKFITYKFNGKYFVKVN